ncbi:hypothetical protein BDZ45DRAFT_8929, partial [Acephala macrosclerotiorum]
HIYHLHASNNIDFFEAAAIIDYEYITSLAQITGSEKEDRYKDLVASFPSISLLPSQPYNSMFRTFHATPEIPHDPPRSSLSCTAASPRYDLRSNAI